jgi:hypothetical protein
MKKIALFLVLLSILLSVEPIVSAQAEEAKDSIYAQSQKIIVPIQELQSICTPGLPQSIQNVVTLGTGFYVLRDEPVSKSLWLVTARHVVEPHADLFAKGRAGAELKTTLYMTLPRAQWVFHPSPTKPAIFPIDVAVMKVKAEGIIAFRYCPAECSEDTTLKKQFMNHLGDKPEPTNHALFFGYPAGDVAPGELPPFVRSGIVAYAESNPQMKIGGLPLADDSIFFIDAPSFGGNSGGPVMREPSPFQSQVQLFGLVTGSSPSHSYTIVTSVARIKETIDYAVQQTSIPPQYSWSTTPPSFSHSCK